ncbi:MAG: flavin reductase [Dehalococcoidia bacterium]|nr:flavin reductase [Dehalococcoidia bacterium]
MNLEALRTITYGIYLICSAKGSEMNGQIANTVVQVCSEPPTVSVCINKGNLTHEFIQTSRAFTVSILSQDTPLPFIGKFGFRSGRDLNKFEGVSYRTGKTGAPIVLDNTLAYLEAKLVNEADTRTHTIFIGEVVDANVISEGEPMTYSYYQRVKRGTTPKTAPSYVARIGKGG